MKKNKNKELLPKQKAFCFEFVVDKNATAAYKRAGYKCKGKQAGIAAAQIYRTYFPHMCLAISGHFCLSDTVTCRLQVQGQLQLNRCSHKDFQHEVFIPAAAAAFHHDAVLAGMLL
jgi:hypothetical protein